MPDELNNVTRELACDDPAASAALNLILGGEARDAAGVVAQRLADFRADCERRQLRPDLLFAAYEGQPAGARASLAPVRAPGASPEVARLAGACVALVSPGSAALMLIPPAAQTSERCRAATGRALAAARQASAERSIVLLQLLQPPGDTALGGILQHAGFTHLTTLVYMQHGLAGVGKAGIEPDSLRWIGFTPAAQRVFCDTLARTYEGSLDCPELSDLRAPREILASHRSAGEFDPKIWWLALRGDEPVGVLLLARLGGREIVEVVYLGVARAARGTGVADCLLDRALSAARHLGAQTLALAVDERNAPARRLYARRGFVEIARRAAWIATNPRTEGYVLGTRDGA